MKKIVFYALAHRILNCSALGYPKEITSLNDKIEYVRNDGDHIKNVKRAINKKHNISYAEVQNNLYELSKLGLLTYTKHQFGTYFRFTNKGWEALINEVNKDKAVNK